MFYNLINNHKYKDVTKMNVLHVTSLSFSVYMIKSIKQLYLKYRFFFFFTWHPLKHFGFSPACHFCNYIARFLSNSSLHIFFGCFLQSSVVVYQIKNAQELFQKTYCPYTRSREPLYYKITKNMSQK